MSWTPGPWRIGKNYGAIVADHPSGWDWGESVKAYGGHLVCESVATEANAHLIAAAPELAEALRSLMPYLEDYLKTNPGEDMGFMLNRYMDEAKEALARAKEKND